MSFISKINASYDIAASTVELNRPELLSWIKKDFLKYLESKVDMSKLGVHYSKAKQK